MMSSFCDFPSDNKSKRLSKRYLKQCPKRLSNQYPKQLPKQLPSDSSHHHYKFDCDTRLRSTVLDPRDSRYAEMPPNPLGCG